MRDAQDSRAWVRPLAALCCAMLVIGACGTRRSEQDHAAAARAVGSVTQEGPTSSAPPTESAGDDATSVSPEGARQLGAPEATAVQSPGAAVSNGPRSAAPNASGTARAGSGANPAAAPARAAQGGVPTKSGAASSSEPVPTKPVEGAPGPAPTKKSTIKIGSVGTISGFVGEMFKGSITAIQIWTRWKNDHGGVNGHPVQHLVYDDGGDPARHRASIQQMVEKDGVIAIVGDNGFLALKEDSVRYVEQKRVPIVGGDTLHDLWVESPMLFPQMAAGKDKLWSEMVAAADTIGKGGKFGYILCSEGPICQEAQKWWPEYAKRNGLDVAYGSQMSMTQPSFTAECLAARNAGVKFLMLGMDTNSERRVISSCEQQGFHPIFGLVQATGKMAADRGIEDAIVVANTFPWPLKDTPATKEFHDVLARYAPNADFAYDFSQGWVTAKLFEKATINLPDNPTSADVLRGLWSMRDETLGGLSAPLTFTEGQTATPVTCYWPVQVKGGKWTAPLGTRGVCKPRP